MHTELGADSDLVKACNELKDMGRHHRATLVICDADYGVKKADWDQEPWTPAEFKTAVEVRLARWSALDHPRPMFVISFFWFSVLLVVQTFGDLH